MKLLIVLHHRFSLWNTPPQFLEWLRAGFPQLEIVHCAEYDAALPHLPDADILVTWSLRPDQFALARRLRWIHSPAAAVHAVLIPEVVSSDVLVTNARQVHGPVVAEHAMALLLALAKRLPLAMRLQQRHVWGQQQLFDGIEEGTGPAPGGEAIGLREIAGATLGIIGAGSIGSEIARRALAFGLRLLIVREHPQKGTDFLPGNVGQDGDFAAVKVFSFPELNDVLPVCDYVILAAPLTPKTRGLMDAARLGCMQPHACLINVARGALLEEPALITALRRGQIAAAALDVFEHEPLPADSPLWDLPNVLITPHSAALTDRLWERHFALLSDNLRRFFSGEPLQSQVDKARGY